MQSLSHHIVFNGLNNHFKLSIKIKPKIFTAKMSQDYRIIGQACLFTIRTSIYKTSSAPGACCSTIAQGSQTVLSTFYESQFIAPSWLLPEMAGAWYCTVADQSQKKKFPLRWLKGHYMALWLQQGKKCLSTDLVWIWSSLQLYLSILIY